MRTVVMIAMSLFATVATFSATTAPIYADAGAVSAENFVI